MLRDEVGRDRHPRDGADVLEPVLRPDSRVEDCGAGGGRELVRFRAVTASHEPVLATLIRLRRQLVVTARRYAAI
jgi:hypothetical protein